MSANDTLLDGADLHRILRAACSAAGGQKPWATARGIPPKHVNDVLASRRAPSEILLAALGLGRVTRYRHRNTA